ncbi:GH92 family glycosyl hydrolase [Alkalibacterium sp.]|nr:MAG: alpha-mannosidase [Alkalibacterium sp.]
MKTVEWIDTRHGTLNRSAYSNGNTLPYTGTPFGMHYFVPQSQGGSSWFFDPTYPITQGIRLSHQPSPWMGDYSWLLFTPVSGDLPADNVEALQSSYKESEAVFNPHRVVIDSLRYRVKTTLVPTKRGAKLDLENYGRKNSGLYLSGSDKLSFQWEKESKKLYGSLPQSLNDGKGSLALYFVLDFSCIDHSNIEVRTAKEGSWQASSEGESDSLWITILSEHKKISIDLGTSFISREQAELNLSREVTGHSIDALAAKSAEEWSGYLDRIQVKDRDKQKVLAFNQYLYRLFLFPQTYFEYDEANQPIHFDTYSGSVKTGKFFTNNGFWDTYRTVYPLFSLIAPDIYKDILEGLAHFYKESGHLPKWLSPDERGLMPGTLINAVIADAAVKGLMKEEDKMFFLNAMIKEATTPPSHSKFGRAGVQDMLEYGYVTNEEVENVNQTQDNAYSDFCIRQVADSLGQHETAKRFEKEALNYRNLYEETTQFLRGKSSDGTWTEAFTPEDWGFDYTEGSAWQNAHAFYHDNQGFIELIGGDDAFITRLVDLANEKPVFDIGNYGMEIHEMSEMATADFGQIAISNQPSFHLPYLYTYGRKPEYTQHTVKQLCTHGFSDGFDGFPGDEDNGSMSGWFIFSMLGFYPVTPGTNQYVLGIPQFDEAKIMLPEEKTFSIKVESNVPQYSFVKAVELNGETYTPLYLTHETLSKGGNMTVSLSLLPGRRCIKDDDLPYSLSKEME